MVGDDYKYIDRLGYTIQKIAIACLKGNEPTFHMEISHILAKHYEDMLQLRDKEDE